MSNKTRVNSFIHSFRMPLIVLTLILLTIPFYTFGFAVYGNILAITAIVVGSYTLFIDALRSLMARQYALDYIAILAIIVAFLTGDYIVGSIIALMLATGRTLEEYSIAQAKSSLTHLIDRIPQDVLVYENDSYNKKLPIEDVRVGDTIFIRRGEVIPLDGVLKSKTALTDESSLTGEPYFIDKLHGDFIRSGTINTGNPIIIEVSKVERDSTYQKIINLVQAAQNERSPLVRLADRYSTVFTLLTLSIAAVTYYFSHNIDQVLAVLVIATPCPLILATPIALMGGVNAAAKKRIIVKKLASLELLSRITALIFDKTGTITLGKPTIIDFRLTHTKKDMKEILAIALAIERNSLHPLAKAIVEYANKHHAPQKTSSQIKETIGAGIEGIVDNTNYTLKKAHNTQGMKIEMLEDTEQIALFSFEDELKEDSKETIADLIKLGHTLFIYTGDKKQAAEKVVQKLDLPIQIHAGLTPEQKQKGIASLKKSGHITAMIGDGINDAPALALSDVGMVYSNEEQTAATDAADIVFLGNEFTLVRDSLLIAKKTIRIALQSIWWGMALSVIGMILASIGLIPPITGAFIQEAIDIAVIMNALRASRS